MSELIVKKVVLTAKTVIVAAVIWVAEIIAGVTEMATWLASFLA